VKNKDSALEESSFHRHRISRFVFCHEGLAKLVETPRLYFSAHAVHQVQIKMQIVQRDQAKPENLLSLDQVANVAARKFATGLACAVFFYWSYVQRELCIL
jgi:hypothetical protein